MPVTFGGFAVSFALWVCLFVWFVVWMFGLLFAACGLFGFGFGRLPGRWYVLIALCLNSWLMSLVMFCVLVRFLIVYWLWWGCCV